MARGEKQKIIIELCEKILGCATRHEFPVYWLPNSHWGIQSKFIRTMMGRLFVELDGSELGSLSKGRTQLRYDGYFERIGLGIEFDELQHFTTARLRTLELMSSDRTIGFDHGQYIDWCREHCFVADRYRASKPTQDFPGESGRTRQRAYLDCLKDLVVVPCSGLSVLRVAEFEFSSPIARNEETQRVLESTLDWRLRHL